VPAINIQSASIFKETGSLLDNTDNSSLRVLVGKLDAIEKDGTYSIGVEYQVMNVFGFIVALCLKIVPKDGAAGSRGPTMYGFVPVRGDPSPLPAVLIKFQWEDASSIRWLSVQEQWKFLSFVYNKVSRQTIACAPSCIVVDTSPVNQMVGILTDQKQFIPCKLQPVNGNDDDDDNDDGGENDVIDREDKRTSPIPKSDNTPVLKIPPTPPTPPTASIQLNTKDIPTMVRTIPATTTGPGPSNTTPATTTVEGATTVDDDVDDDVIFYYEFVRYLKTYLQKKPATFQWMESIFDGSSTVDISTGKLRPESLGDRIESSFVDSKPDVVFAKGFGKNMDLKKFARSMIETELTIPLLEKLPTRKAYFHRLARDLLDIVLGTKI
jgi:hypothetical protein